MVSTKKFSEFASGGDLELNDIAVGLDAGANAQFTTTLQFSQSGTTAERPALPAIPTIRYNTTLSSFEYYDGVSWEQISGGLVDTITGTANEIDVDSTDPKNIVISLPITLIAPGTAQVGNLLLDTSTISSTNTDGNINFQPNGAGVSLFNTDTEIDASSQVQIAGFANAAAIHLNSFSLANNGAAVILTRSRSETQGAYTPVQTGDTLAQISIGGDDGTTLYTNPYMQSIVSGTVSAGVIPTQTKLYTTTTAGAAIVGLSIENDQSVTIGSGSSTLTINASTAIDGVIDDDTMATATATNVPTAESVVAYIAATAGGAGGSNTQIQYNSSGTLAGDSGFTTDGVGNLTSTGSFLLAPSTGAAASIISSTNNVATLALEADNSNSADRDAVIFWATGGFTVWATGLDDSDSDAFVWAHSSDLGTTNRMRLSTAGALSAITQLDVDNLRIDGSTISSQNTNGNINYKPNGAGVHVFSGNVGIGASNAAKKLDLVAPSSSDLAFRWAVNTADSTDKLTQLGSRHYLTAQADVCNFFTINNATQNRLILGGGSGATNSCTSVEFALGATNTTTSGTRIGEFTSSGLNVISGSITGLQLNIDNLRLDGNTISSQDTNGNIDLTPNGTGTTAITGPATIIAKSGTNSSLIVASRGAANFSGIQAVSGTSSFSYLSLGSTADNNICRLFYTHSTNTLTFRTNNISNMTLGPTGNTVILGSLTTSQTGGLIGTTINNNAQAGSVGEFVLGQVLPVSAVSLTTATTANITSISLTAGDWDVWGHINFNTQAATTVMVSSIGSSSRVSATISGAACGFDYGAGITASLTSGAGYVIPQSRLNVSSTTTVYLVTNTVFSGGRCSAFGRIYARRRR